MFEQKSKPKEAKSTVSDQFEIRRPDDLIDLFRRVTSSKVNLHVKIDDSTFNFEARREIATIIRAMIVPSDKKSDEVQRRFSEVGNRLRELKNGGKKAIPDQVYDELIKLAKQETHKPSPIGIEVRQKVKDWSNDLNNPKSQRFNEELSRLFRSDNIDMPLRMPKFVQQTKEVHVLKPQVVDYRPVSSLRARVHKYLSPAIRFVAGLVGLWRGDK
jgi:hypothetical protein